MAAGPTPARRIPCVMRVLLLLPGCSGLYDPVNHIASARIYGNVDAFAYYYLDLLIGTPPQRVSVIVDTGSGVTAFTCRSCGHCGNHIDPAFDFERSTTAKWTPCGSDCKHSCRNGHCSYTQGYTEGSSISGWWFRDKVHLGDAIQRNPPVYTSVGCHQDENRLFYTQKANGIMGIRPPGNGMPTLLQELFADREHIDQNVFSLCFAEWGGRIVVGGYNRSYHTGPIVYVPLTTTTGYYNVKLTGMRVDGQEVASHFGNTMIDSGTTFVYMATAAYRSLRNAIEGYCAKHQGCGAKKSGTCWDIPDQYEGLELFPEVELVFVGKVTTWIPGAYMYRKGITSSWCYAFEDDGPKAGTVLGASWMMQHEVIFDLGAKQVGIAPANCPHFRKRPDHDPNADLTPPTAAPGARPAVQHASSGPLNISAVPTERLSGTLGARTAAARATPGAAEGGTPEAQRTIVQMLQAFCGVAAVITLVSCAALGAKLCRARGAAMAESASTARGAGAAGARSAGRATAEAEGPLPAVLGAEFGGTRVEEDGEEDPLVASIRDEF